MSALSAISAQPSYTPRSDVPPPSPTTKPVDRDGDRDADRGERSPAHGGLRVTV